MQQINIQELINKFRQGACTEEELNVLENWYLQWEPENYDMDGERLDALMNEVWVQMPLHEPTPVKPVKLWSRIAVAASLVAMLAVGVYFFKGYRSKVNYHSEFATQKEIVPGAVGATLTLANGKKIRLNDTMDGEIAKESGVVITKTKDGRLVYELQEAEGDVGKVNTLSTAPGENYQIRLPDGSLVWLNASSSLTYTTSLKAQGKRKVELLGEGYFEVAKDRLHPFVVKTRDQEIEVLGTQFNVNAYMDEDQAKTTLLEGSVKINSHTLLVPGEQAISKKGQIKVVAADTKMETAWINGQFVFNAKDFESAMNMIARWYNVEIVYEYKPVDLNLGGSISRSRSLADVLKRLEQTEEVKFKIEGRRVSVIK